MNSWNTYICKQCNKSYKSYRSLWNHNHNYHKHHNHSKLLKITQKIILLEESQLNCRFCKKLSSRKDNLNRYEKN